MKLFYWVTIITILAGCKASSDLSSAEQDSPIQSVKLFTAGDETVYTDEFAYVYRKNNINNDSAFTHGDIKGYLDLYIKFKLKIAEAKSRGMDTTAAFKREFSTYRDQLKKPYLTENRVTEQLIKEAYERYKQEVRASHILVKVDEHAAPSDTLKAYNQILDIRTKANDGEDFGALAQQYSDDPSAKTNKGNLGYFTAFQMVYPFESGAYNTAVGEISQPLRTRFGYHILKVHDKRPTLGSVEVSHIMVRIQPNKEDSLQARNKIFEIYDQAVGGVSWDALAKQFSEDINTKNTGGKLRPFKVGQMPFEFQEAAFALNEPGDISDPIMTPFGWHIIKLEGKEPLESFDDMENSIKSRIDRDSRTELNKKAFVARLKRENNFKEGAVKAELHHYADSSLIRGKWRYSKELDNLNEVLFEIGDRQYTLKNFFDYVMTEQRPNSYQPDVYLQLLYNNFADSRIIAYEEDHLEDKYEDYRMLVNEYKEGILLFELMEKEVWNKAVEDTTGLRAFYNDNIDKYQWNKRVEATIYNASSQEVIAEIQKMIQNKDSVNLSKKLLEEKYNANAALTLQVTEGTFEKGDNALIDAQAWEAGMYTTESDGRYNLIWIEEVLEPSAKALHEIKGLVISDYQNFLEKKWIKSLEQKYPVSVNESGLNYIYEELEK